MSTLTITTQALAFEDASATSNPAQRPINWKRSITGLTVYNPSTELHPIDPLGSKTVIDGARTTLMDGTTEFSLELSDLDPTRYRITNTGGTAPAFRTARTVTANGVELTLTVLANQSMTVAAAAGTPFSNVQVGDVFFLPGVSTGDGASPFNTLNLGEWTVLAASGAQLTVARPTGTLFEGVSEVVTPTSNAQVQAYSSAGVQVGDTVDLSDGFATTSLRAYEILAVNPAYIEILSTVALGAETGIVPGAAGMVIYTAAKRFLQVEVDQECVVRVNGDSSDFNKVTPWIAGEGGLPGTFLVTGPVWRLVLVNRTNVPLNAAVLSAE